MLGLVRAQAQAAPETVEKEHAQRAAEDIRQGMKKGGEHGGQSGSFGLLVAREAGDSACRVQAQHALRRVTRGAGRATTYFSVRGGTARALGS
jgi:hypothetical protein